MHSWVYAELGFSWAHAVRRYLRAKSLRWSSHRCVLRRVAGASLSNISWHIGIARIPSSCPEANRRLNAFQVCQKHHLAFNACIRRGISLGREASSTVLPAGEGHRSVQNRPVFIDSKPATFRLVRRIVRCWQVSFHRIVILRVVGLSEARAITRKIQAIEHQIFLEISSSYLVFVSSIVIVLVLVLDLCCCRPGREFR